MDVQELSMTSGTDMARSCYLWMGHDPKSRLRLECGPGCLMRASVFAISVTMT